MKVCPWPKGFDSLGPKGKERRESTLFRHE